ncbi:MAG: hypothetical protein AAGB93_00230 [Planctomycetota bacterium]
MVAAPLALLLAVPVSLAPAQHREPQSFVPQPPGGPATRFAFDLTVDGPLALVSSGDPAEVWVYRRSGLDWAPVEPLPVPPLSPIGFLGAFLGGGRAYVAERYGKGAYRTHVFEELGGAWVQVDEVPDFLMTALSPDGDVAVGILSPFGYGIAERGPTGWQLAYDTRADGVSITGLVFAVDRDVAVLGNNTTLDCHPMWEGELHVIERLPNGTWDYTQQIGDPLGCFESRLGSFVGVDGDQVLATARHGFHNVDASVLVFERAAGPGTWTYREQLSAGTGAGLHVQDGFLLTGSTAAPRTPRAELFRRTPAGWVAAASFDVEAWPTLAPDGQFAGPRDFPIALALVDAPAQTGLGRRAGALVRQPEGAGEGLASFDPVVSASTCPAAANSTGAGADLVAVGSDLLADVRLALVASSLPSGSLVLPLVSNSFGVVANPGGSPGDLCVGLPAVRMVGLAGPSSPGGRFQARIDLDGLPYAPVGPGDRLFFQAWFRDAGGTGFSNGVAVQMF